MSSMKAESSRRGHREGRASDASTSQDMSQAIAEKRALRREYRALIARTNEARGNLADHTARDIYDFVNKGEELRSKVKAPTEGILDARFLLNVSDMGAQMARNMKLNANAFDVDEYINRVAKFVGGTARSGPGGNTSHTNRGRRRRTHGGTVAANDDESDDGDDEDIDSWDWRRLGHFASQFSRRAPTMDLLLGPLAVEQKTRANTGKRARLERDSQEIAPQQLNEKDIERSENETTRLVHQIARLLEDEGGTEGCNLFEFVINPESFSNTVENLFYVSFLIRDGKASISDEGDLGYPVLMRSNPPIAEDYEEGLTKRQIVLELDQAMYRDLIEAYGIHRSIIPTRRPAQTGTRQGKWYG